MVQTVKSGITALVLLLSACATTSSSIYFSSQTAADASLTAFDKNNPDCQLWTNWQKMCSRTGRDGSTFCSTDPGIRVKPSRPFCTFRVIPKEGHPFPVSPDVPETLTEPRASTNSRNRFCAKFWDGKAQPLFILDDETAALHKNIPLCAGYKISRPFNGLDSVPQQNPRCKKWNKIHTGMLYCSEKVEDDICTYLGNGVSTPEITEDGIWAGRDDASETQAVWGLYCLKRIGNLY